MGKDRKIVDFPNIELLYEEAGEWIVRLDDGPLTSEERESLSEWVNQSAYHKKLLLDTAEVWDRMDLLADVSELIASQQASNRQSRPITAALVAVAASLACIGILTFYLGGQSFQNSPAGVDQHQGTPRHFETPIGGSETVELGDGSVAKLNTATRIQVDMSETQRKIVLLSGEAFFEVAWDARVPFVVAVGETVIQAVGTAFGVRKRVDQIEVTVTEGLVQVRQDDSGTLEENEAPFETMLVRAGQVAQVNQSGVTEGISEVKAVEPREITRRLSWRQQMLAFDNNSLQEVVDEFSRYTPFKINIADPETASVRVGGYFRSDDIVGLLMSLESNFGISVEQVDASTFQLRKSGP